MNRNLLVYLGLLGAGVLGFLWVRKNKAGSSSSGSSSSAAKTPAYYQQQEVSDFQIFSALTSQQQASDVNFLSQAASLFSGGASTASTSGTTASVSGSGSSSAPSSAPPQSVIPSPTPTASAPPATTPASSPSSSSGVTYLEPGGPVNFSQAPPPGYGYSFQNGQWGLIPGGGVGYVAA